MLVFQDLLSWRHAATVIAVYYASLIFYRLYLHPLAKFPGPRIAAITRWYEGYYDVIRNGQYTWKIMEMHRKYGPIIRISPYELHVNDPAFYEKLYRQEGHWNKYDWAYDAFVVKPSMVCTIDHHLHKRRRAAISSFFSKSNVGSRIDIVQKTICKLCSYMDKVAGTKESFNLGSAISAFARDVAMPFLVDMPLNDLDKKDFNNPLTSLVQGSGHVWRITKHVRWFGPVMKALPMPWMERVADDGTKAFFGLVKDMRNITHRIMTADDPNAPRTMIHDILHSSLPPSEKTLDRMGDELGTITGAAFETAAHTIRYILYYVYSDPVILGKLRAELAAAAAAAAAGGGLSPPDVELATLEKMPYLTAVVMEGLRLSPALFTRMARVAPDRELVYAGRWRVPAGTPVGMTTLLMHWDEAVYPDPRSFDPERWIDPEVRRRADKTYAPFSRGTRMCIGMHLAWAELYLTISALVQRYELEFDGAGTKDVEPYSDQFAIGTKDQDGFRVFVKAYKSS